MRLYYVKCPKDIGLNINGYTGVYSSRLTVECACTNGLGKPFVFPKDLKDFPTDLVSIEVIYG